MKAHSKIHGTREYRCDCGTLFSRRDSFITHRAFCDAVATESSKPQAEAETPVDDEDPKSEIAPATAASTRQDPAPAVPSSTTVASPVSPVQNQELNEGNLPDHTTAQALEESPALANSVASCSSIIGSCSNGSSSSNVFASLFTSSGSLQPQTSGFTDLFPVVTCPDHIPELAPSSSSEPLSLCLTMNLERSSIFVSSGRDHRQYTPAPRPALSATALLQKAALIGASSSNASLLRGLGVVSSSSSTNVHQRGPQIEPDGASLASGLALELDGGSGLKELMLGTPSIFGPKHITLDLLGLGMAASGGPTGGYRL